MRERGTINLHRRFTVLLAALLLVSAFVAATHHHENRADDHDCPICLVSHHQHATGQSSVAFDGIPCFSETIYSAPATVVTERIFISFLKSRAPPA
jgi:hypothetical protein